MHNWKSETDESVAGSEYDAQPESNTSNTEETLTPKSIGPKPRKRKKAQPDREQAAADLMKIYGMWWGKKDGKRILYVPSSAPEHAAQHVKDTLAGR